MRNWSLFLAHPTDWNKCSASKNTQDTTRTWLWVLKSRLESLRLEITQVCSAVSCFPRDNIDDNHLCDEHMKSTLPIVCHMPESILWLTVPIFLGPPRCQVVQSMQACQDNLYLTILQLIPIPPLWTDGHPNKDEKPCKFTLLSCLPIHGIAQQFFEHVTLRDNTPRRTFSSPNFYLACLWRIWRCVSNPTFQAH